MRPPPLVLLAALAFLVQVDARVMTPLLPAIADSLDASVSAVGLAMTAYMLPYGLCQFVYGPLADRYGTIRVVRVAAVGFGLAVFATGWAPGVLAFDALRLVDGALAAAVIPLTLAYIGDSVPYARRQATIGRLVAVMSLAQSLSAAIGGAIAHFVSWRALFAGAGLVVLLPAAGLLAVGPARPPGGGASRAGYAAVLRRRAAWVLYAVVGFEGLFLWGGFTYLGVVAKTRFGLNDLEVGLLLAVYGAVTLVAALALGRIRQLVAERHLAAFGGMLKGVGYLALIPAAPVGVFALGLGTIALGYVCLHTTLQTRATELSPEARGTAVALFAFFLFLGGAVGAAALGPLVEHGWERLFLLVCGVSLLALGALAVPLLGRSPAP